MQTVNSRRACSSTLHARLTRLSTPAQMILEFGQTRERAKNGLDAMEPMPDQSNRRFLISDGMILIAATAVGIALTRAILPEIDKLRTGSPPSARRYFLVQYALNLVIPTLTALTLGLLLLRLKKPRPCAACLLAARGRRLRYRDVCHGARDDSANRPTGGGISSHAFPVHFHGLLRARELRDSGQLALACIDPALAA